MHRADSTIHNLSIILLTNGFHESELTTTFLSESWEQAKHERGNQYTEDNIRSLDWKGVYYKNAPWNVHREA
jgi:hypothetical protein